MVVTATVSSAVACPAPLGGGVVNPLPEPAGVTVPTPLPALVPFLREVPDPRDARGVRHPLVAILTVLCLAMLSGIQGYLPTAEWAAALDPAELRAVGFVRDKAPAASTFYEVLRALSWDALETQLRAWATTLEPALAARPAAPSAAAKTQKSARRPAQKTRARTTPPPEPDPQGLSIDGKTARGSWKRGAELAHVLAVVSHRCGLTLASAPLARKQGELTTVRPLLKELVLTGFVVTFDAQFTQADLAETIRERGGDYLMRVKENQPTLLAAIRERLAPEHPDAAHRHSVSTHDQAHGRTEQRTLVAHAVQPGEIAWPGAAQVFAVSTVRLQRRADGTRPVQTSVFYGVTSLTAEEADPARLLRLFRGHWTVENRVFWVKDVVLGEDRSPATQANLVAVMAGLRSAVVNVIRSAGLGGAARTLRLFNASRQRAMTALGCG